jgi:hypothetical protein
VPDTDSQTNGAERGASEQPRPVSELMQCSCRAALVFVEANEWSGPSTPDLLLTRSRLVVIYQCSMSELEADALIDLSRSNCVFGKFAEKPANRKLTPKLLKSRASSTGRCNTI